MYDDVAQNLKAMRHAKRPKISKADMVQALEDRGVSISLATYSNWESGRSAIPAAAIAPLADILGCSVYHLTHLHTMIAFASGDQERDQDKSYSDIMTIASTLTRKEKDILAYMFSAWDGDRAALLAYNALYMSLPPDLRYESAYSLLAVYDMAAELGRLVPGHPDADPEIVRKAWEALGKK